MTSLLVAGGEQVTYYPLEALRPRLATPLERLPITVKVLLENVLRHAGTAPFSEDDVTALAAWRPGITPRREAAFLPARVLLQDFTGVPVVVDLAAMRDAVARLGGDSRRVNPAVPADLVIDHRPEEIVIEVRNPVGGQAAAATGGGHGLIGMRERVDALHGRLAAGPEADGTFRVHAEIPRGRA